MVVSEQVHIHNSNSNEINWMSANSIGLTSNVFPFKNSDAGRTDTNDLPRELHKLAVSVFNEIFVEKTQE